jgi:hypothetical protein
LVERPVSQVFSANKRRISSHLGRKLKKKERKKGRKEKSTFGQKLNYSQM